MPAPGTADAGLVVHRVFEAVAAARPRAVALAHGAEEVTYADAERRANRLAHLLVSMGVGAESRVGVLLDPAVDFVLTVLAVLKAGGCYVPLDHEHPPARLRDTVADVDAAVVVTTRAHAGRVDASAARALCLDEADALLARQPAHAPQVPVRPDDLAYVIHTSGSTGRPKGVAVRHRGLVRLVREAPWLRLGPDEVIPLATSICFDVSVFETWAALLNGGRLVLAPGVTRSLRGLRRMIAEHGVTTMWLTAGLFHTVVDEDVDALAGVGRLLVGGEAPSAKHVRALRETHPEIRFVNAYGPTEATVLAATYPLGPQEDPGDAVPIGAAVPSVSLHVLDPGLREVPDGRPGELYIGGDGLARGYLGRPGLTAARFVADPFATEPGGRLYATGDLVLRRRDGALLYLGRIDHQVKIRGFRVELGEVESALRRHPAVRDVVVDAHGDVPERRLLVAYPVLDPGAGDPDAALAAVRSWLAERLPAHLVPDTWRPLERLPLRANGKVDRRALPDPFGR